MKVQEQIRHDIEKYMKENNIDHPQKAIDKLASFLPDVMREELKDYPPVIHAWIALQLMNQSSLRYHKSEELGEFIYNSNMYDIEVSVDTIYIHYNTYYKGEIELPEGCISTRKMFECCALPEGFTLRDKFDTSKVTDMRYMFAGCKLPKGFTLGDKFDTSNVTNMHGMFSDCTISEGFTLGDKFDTSKVTCMRFMFHYCEFPEGFTLGDKFDTSNVTDMYGMFGSCVLPEGFILGDKFDTSKVTDMSIMFGECVLPESFTLDAKFVISKGTKLSGIFESCTHPDGSDATRMCEKEVLAKLKSNS